MGRRKIKPDPRNMRFAKRFGFVVSGFFGGDGELAGTSFIAFTEVFFVFTSTHGIVLIQIHTPSTFIPLLFRIVSMLRRPLPIFSYPHPTVPPQRPFVSFSP